MTDLKIATPDGTLPTDGFLFGADSQTAASPSIYPMTAVRTALVPFNLKTESTGPLALTGKTLLTVENGNITVTMGFHTVDTEQMAASDDIDTIAGGVDGYMVILRAASSARTVVLKHDTDNILCGADVSLDHEGDVATLIYDSDLTKWLLVAFSSNGV